MQVILIGSLQLIPLGSRSLINFVSREFCLGMLLIVFGLLNAYYVKARGHCLKGQ